MALGAGQLFRSMGPVYFICHRLARAFARAVFDHRLVGEENRIEEGPALICANHVSFLDPPLVSVSFDREIHFLARRTLYSNPVARWLFPRVNVIPVDQERSGYGGLKTVIRLLGEGHRVLIFPEGSRSPDGRLQPAQPGTGLIVAKTRVPVVPVRIFGAYEALPVGAACPRLSTTTVVAGEPLRFDREPLPEGRDAYQEISNRIMEAIANIPCPPDRLPAPPVNR